MKPLIKLDKQDIAKAIGQGNNWDGGHALVVAPDGSDHRIVWVQRQRQFDPWPEGWQIIGIPSLYPEGSGEENDMCSNIIFDHKLEDEYEAVRDDLSETQFILEKYPHLHKEYEENALEWLLGAFLAACNGYGEDLNDPEPWGRDYDEDGTPDSVIVQPPAEFEWDE